METKNDMTPVDCGAIVLIPQGNLNDKNPGTYGGMMKALEAGKKSSGAFKASTANGFTPGSTTKGIDGNWGTMTCSK